MRELYTRVNQVTKNKLYQFMRDNDVSTLNYNFKRYFDSCVKKYNIKILEHHFSSRKIEGLTLIDDNGVSISYERENPTVKQNFTKCHELGHFILGHSGSMFTELSGGSDSLYESEANLFSAIILMPDIVLLSKIYYRKDRFSRILSDLVVSAEALIYRLKDLFRYYLKIDSQELSKTIQEYKDNKNKSLINLFEQVKDDIEKDYRKITANPIISILHQLEEADFVASNNYPDLLENSFRKDLEQANPNIETWAEFDFGKTVGYVWRKDKLTKKQAQSRARNILLLEKR